MKSVKGRRVTAQEVADRAGVSRHAVSRCFKPGAYLAEGKRRLIVATAKELGYRPNALAAGLKGKSSRLIAIVSGNLSNHYDAEVVSCLVELLTSMGKWPVVLGGGSEDIRNDRTLDVLAYPLDAMVLRAGSVDAEIAQQCRQLGIPLILSGRRTDGLDRTDSVCCDNAHGAGLAVRCLIERGRSRIAYIGGPKDLFSEQERAMGFVGALSAVGLKPANMISSDFSFEGGFRSALELLAGSGQPDAVFCSNDAMALGVLSAARHRLGLNIPEDLSVIGFDDIAMAAWPTFELTTVRNSVHQMVEAIRTLLSERLAMPDGPGRHLSIEPQLVLRGSH